MERAPTQGYPTSHQVQLHLAVDAENHEVIAVELTAAFVGDAEVLPELLDQPPTAKSVVSVAADGAYDTQACHRAVLEHRATALIPRPALEPWTGRRSPKISRIPAHHDSEFHPTIRGFEAWQQ